MHVIRIFLYFLYDDDDDDHDDDDDDDEPETAHRPCRVIVCFTKRDP